MRVLDSSVALKWILPEIDSAKAIGLRGQEFIAPDIFPTEVAHALSRAARKGTVTGAHARSGLTIILRGAPELRDSVPLLPRALEISLLTRCSVYDALFVALAEQEGVQLITADEKLVNNLQEQFTLFVRLSSL